MKRPDDDPSTGAPGMTPDLLLARLRSAIEAHLAAVLPAPRDEGDLVVRALREAALSPGKRVRPLLLLATAQSLGHRPEPLLDAACALELVHAASLVMDDLPCMDDARTRRGRPTLHLQFGEDVAALAVVALLSEAFRLVGGGTGLEISMRAQLVVLLTEAVGCRGLVQGQLRDLRPGAGPRTAREAAQVNQCKTGALFRAALDMAALAAGTDARQRALLDRFGEELGQAFQLLDDLKDNGAAGATGKDLHQDQGKTTLLALLGPDGARARLQAHLQQAEALLGLLFPHDGLVLHLLRHVWGVPTAAP